MGKSQVMYMIDSRSPKWGTKGTSDGQFNKPHSMSNDMDGNVYVTDMNNHRVQKFTPEGQFVVG